MSADPNSVFPYWRLTNAMCNNATIMMADMVALLNYMTDGTGDFDINNLIVGGTITMSAMTQGSVLHVGADGLVSEDNAHFFYDSSVKGLSVGFNGPVGNFDGLAVSSLGCGNFAEGLVLRIEGLAHGITDLLPTNAYCQLKSVVGEGTHFEGATESDQRAVLISGYNGDSTPASATVTIRGAKKNGAAIQALSATEPILDVVDASYTSLVKVHGTGNVAFAGVGISAWHSDCMALEFPRASIFTSKTVGGLSSAANAYYDGAWKFKANADASLISSGAAIAHYISSASGSAGGAITWWDLLKISRTEVTVNDQGSDVDFRVEGDTESNMIFGQASDAAVGFCTGAPRGRIHVFGSTAAETALFELYDSSATNSSSASARLLKSTAQNMTDGFGVGIDFVIRDSAATDNYIGYIDCIRDGADNTGRVRIMPSLAGSPSLGAEFYSDKTSRFGTVATNYSKFETDGTLHFNGDATVWGVVSVPASMMRVTTSSAPGWASYGAALEGYHFDAASDEYLWFSAPIPPDYKEGTSLIPFVKWRPTTTNGGDVSWRMSARWMNINDTGTARTGLTLLDTADGTQYKLQYHAGSTWSGVSKTIWGNIEGFVLRFASTGTDTYPDDAILIEAGFRYEIDTVGSRTSTTK